MLMELLDTNDAEKAWNWLEKHYAQRELYSYHSKNADVTRWERACNNVFKGNISPHQERTFNDLNKAIELGKPIILTRQFDRWLQYVPKLKNYSNLFVCSSNQNVRISANNILHYRDSNKAERKDKTWLDKKKQNAWASLKELIQKNIAMYN